MGASALVGFKTVVAVIRALELDAAGLDRIVVPARNHSHFDVLAPAEDEGVEGADTGSA